MKTCSKCKKSKPLTDYPCITRMTGGKAKPYYNKMCKTCTSAHNTNRRKAMAIQREIERKEGSGEVNPYFLSRGKVKYDGYTTL